MKWLVRSGVFISAFVLSLLVVWIIASAGSNVQAYDIAVHHPPSDDDAIPAAEAKGVRVLFTGLTEQIEGQGPGLRFLIYNGTYAPIKYSAHSPTSPYPIIKANGIELERVLGCGTGIKTYYILPGRSAEVSVSVSQFVETPKKKANITVGFYLAQFFGGDFSTYFSEPFALPREFQNAVEERVTRMSDLNN